MRPDRISICKCGGIKDKRYAQCHICRARDNPPNRGKHWKQKEVSDLAKRLAEAGQLASPKYFEYVCVPRLIDELCQVPKVNSPC
jgi:hypothetical protein